MNLKAFMLPLAAVSALCSLWHIPGDSDNGTTLVFIVLTGVFVFIGSRAKDTDTL